MGAHDDFIAFADRLIRRDPAARGLLSGETTQTRLAPGHLSAAARDLVERGRSIGIVTGFFVPHGNPPAAETDGPPGAVMLAEVLMNLGMQVRLITDERCSNGVIEAARAAGLDSSDVLVSPMEPGPCRKWCQNILKSRPLDSATHLISVERVGPSHTLETFLCQAREVPAPIPEFKELVPAEARGKSMNMRAEVIDGHSAPLHELFRLADQSHDVATIGIGDGGNEIGMGTIPWEELANRLGELRSPRIICSIATTWTIVSGTSNWGAQALAACTAVLRGRPDALKDWTVRRHEDMLRNMVQRGPAVDGILAVPNFSVDSLPFATYIQPWSAMRRTLDWDD